MRHLTAKAVAAFAVMISGLAGTAVMPVPAAAAAAAAGAAGVTVLGPGAGDGAEQECSGPAVVCPSRIRFGLSTPRVLRLNDALTGLEEDLDHRADLIGSYQDFTEPMYTARLRRAIDSGRTPLVTWEPFDSDRTQRASYPLRRIAAGAYDRYLRAAADQAKAVGKPFIVRFGHEMNGFWYPWGQPRTLHPQSVADPTNTPASYRRAYQHVVDVFRARGATNVAWMWSPNVVDANPSVTLESLYPGKRYVDVIGLSGYLQSAHDTFESRYRPTLDQLASIGRTKPIVIAETGVVVTPTRGPQLAALMEAVSVEPRINGLVYFSQPDKATDYRIHEDAEAQSVLREALRRPRFALSTRRDAAFAVNPVVTGAPRVGSTLTATFRWRGRPTSAEAGWLSCPAADTASQDCARVAWGADLAVGPELRGRHLRATLRVTSDAGSDSTQVSVGPVLNVPPAVAPVGVDMLAGSVRVRLPLAPEQTTHWVLSISDGAKTYLNASTSEHYFNNLVAGTRYTVTLAACDCPSVGPTTSVTFTQLARPEAPTVTSGQGSFSAELPDPAPGQTAWIAAVDGVEEELPVTVTSVVRDGLAPGGHTFGLRAVSGAARTNATVVYPQVF